MYSIFKGQVIGDDDDSKKIINSNERLEQLIEERREELEARAEAYRQQLIEEYIMSLEADDDGKPILPLDEDGNVILPLDANGDQLLYVTSDGFLSEEPEPEPVEEPVEEEAAEEELDAPQIDREAIEAEIRAEVQARAEAESDSIIASANEQAESIISQANTTRDEMVSKANTEIEQLKESANADIEQQRISTLEAAKEEGFAAGNEEGQIKAKEDADAEVARIRAQLESEKQAVIDEYREKEKSMESRMADTFCDLIDKIFGIEFSGKKDILLHLVDNVIANTPSSKEFFIRVNDANYDAVNEKRGELKEKLGAGVELDIVKDPILGIDECQIETDGGVYDCGMDLELENLLKDLRALSLV